MALSSHVDMFNPQSGFAVDGPLALLVGHELGHVVCVAWETGEIVWASRYYSFADAKKSVSIARASGGEIRFRTSRSDHRERCGWVEDRVFAVGDRVVACPADASALVVLDRESGSIRYELDLIDPVSVIGVVDGHVYVTRQTRAECIDVAEGRTLWSTPLPAVPARGVVLGDTLYVPCIDSIVELDRRTGRRMPALQLEAARLPYYGNLAIADDRLWSAAPLAVQCLETRATNPPVPVGDGDTNGVRRAVAALDAVLDMDALSRDEGGLAEQARFEQLCLGIETQVDDDAWVARATALATNDVMRSRLDYARWCRTVRVEEPATVVQALGERLQAPGTRLVAPDARRVVQSHLLLADHFRKAFARLDGAARRRADAQLSDQLAGTQEPRRPPEELRRLAASFAGTEAGIAMAERAAAAFRSAGRVAEGEAVLLQALHAASHESLDAALEALGAYYGACAWPDARGRVEQIAAQIEALVRRYPACSVARLLRLLEQRPAVPGHGDLAWLERGTIGEQVSLLIDCQSIWRSPFFEGHAVMIEGRSRLACISLESREPVWTLDTDEPKGFSTDIERRVSQYERGVVALGHIAIFHEGTDTVAVDLLRGKRLWRLPYGRERAGTAAFRPPVLAISRGALLLAVGAPGQASLESRDMLDGTLRWACTLESDAAGRAYATGDAVAVVKGYAARALALHDTETGRLRASVRIGPEVHYHLDGWVSPDGLLLTGNCRAAPLRSRILTPFRVFLRETSPEPVWHRILADRQTPVWLADGERFLVRGSSHLQRLDLETGEPVWTWQGGRTRIKDVTLLDTENRTVRVLHEGGPHASVGLHATLLALDTGATNTTTELKWTDPRRCRIVALANSEPAYIVEASYLPRKNQQAQAREWTLRGYDTVTGEPLTDTMTVEDGTLYAAVSVTDVMPRLAVRGRHVLLMTRDGIRLFEKMGTKEGGR